MNKTRMMTDAATEGNTRGFWALMATQFQGTFNDNAFKVIVVFLMPALARNTGYPATAIAFLLFNIPFLLFPGYAGFLADRFSKKQVTVMTKYWEVGVMVLGLGAFWLQSIPLLWVSLFLMAMQSAFFSPAKYGILPEILPENRLSWGNGILQLGTMVAIILGSAVGTPMMEAFGERAYLAGAALVVFSCVGLVAAHFITPTRSAAPEQRCSWNPWAGLSRSFACYRADHKLLVALAGIAYFWFAGSLAMQNIIELAKETIASTAMQGQLLTALSLGIGLGSVAAGLLSRGRIQSHLIPLGGLGLAFFSLLLGWGGWGFTANMAFLFGLGSCGGFFVIPLDAMLQQRSPAHMRGDMIASCNFVTFSGMTLSAILFYLLFNVLHVPTNVVFVISAGLSLAITGYICLKLPIFWPQTLAWSIINSAYRLRVEGQDNIPETGGALLVANHTSFADAVILAAATERQVRFIMDQGWYDTPMFHPVARLMNTIPIAGRKNPEATEASLRAASEAIRQGDIVCIFAEGGITRTGELMPFRRGLERIMQDCDAPIIPVYMGNLWGSLLSFSGGRVLWKQPKHFRYPVSVRYGAPLPPHASANDVYLEVKALRDAAPQSVQFALGAVPAVEEDAAA